MDPTLLAFILVVPIMAVLVVVHQRKDKARALEHAAAVRGKTPEQIAEARRLREAAERQTEMERFTRGRGLVSAWLQFLGVLLLLVALGFLVLAPNSEESSVVSLQKLFIGETAGVVGALFLVAGLLLKYLD